MSKPNVWTRLFLWFLPTLSLVVVLVGVLGAEGSALAQKMPAELSEAEEYVVGQVEAGEWAELERRFPDDEEKRVLSADFLVKLLTAELEGVKIHRRGVRIKHAVFNEPLDLRNAVVPHETRLDYCEFSEGVDFSGSYFRRNLTFGGSQFTSPYAAAAFTDMKLGGSAFFQQAVFAGPVEFGHAEVRGNFSASGAKFKSTKAEAIFSHMKVGDTASFTKAIFAGKVDFGYAEITHDFSANGTKFTNGKAEAYFNSMKVGGSAFFQQAVFAGPVDFRGAEFGTNFEAHGAEFKDTEAGANFNGIKVGRNAFFTSASFAGPVDFRAAEITGQFVANRAKFTNGKAEANFNGMKVGDAAFFRQAVFAGPVSFISAEISLLDADRVEFRNTEAEANFNGIKVGDAAFFRQAVFAGPVIFIMAEFGTNFEAHGAEFKDTEAGANFNGMKVGDAAFFRQAVFAGPVSFISAEFGTNFEAHGAEFKDTEAGANFNGIKVGGVAFFENTVFKGPFSIANAEVLDLKIQGHVEKGPPELKRLDLSRTVIQRELTIEDVRIDALMASSLRVQGPATLKGVSVEQEANLQFAHFQTLRLDGVTWPTNPDNLDAVRLEGMTYEHISAGDERDSWENLLEWIDGSAYNSQPYSQLEAFFRADGYPERADDVFVALKRRERREALKLGSPGWWSNLTLDWLVRYGRAPHKAFYWSGLVVFIGLLLFRRRQDVEPRNPMDASKPYNPLWYSLDLFLPFIDLQAADVWMPRQNSWLRRHYARVHTVLGWILIPIGLAAVTGIIK